MITRFAIFIFAVSLLGALGCADDTDDTTTKSAFDRMEFLEYYAQNSLQPRMNELVASCDDLYKSVLDLSTTPTSTQLATTRKVYKQAMLQWQRTSFLNFGPGGKDGLRLTLQEELASWPLALTIIETKVSSQEHKLEDSFRNSRGLLSIEYLLYPDQDIDTAIALLKPERLDYLVAITTKLKDQATAFNVEWQAGYPDQFVANDGTDVTSSTTLLYNEWLRSFELLKNMKIIEPLGLKAGQVGPEPELVESNHAGLSLEFAKAHFNSLIEIYRGADHTGWDNYLQSVAGGTALVEQALTQISVVEQAFDEVPSDRTMKALVAEEHSSLIELQKELQELLPLFKSEMSSLLGLAITYSSADGD